MSPFLTPFRRFKHLTEEGGISAPFIVHWPGGRLSRGRIEKDQVGDVINIMPTILDITGGKYPEALNGKPILSPPGKPGPTEWAHCLVRKRSAHTC